jgi:hypothetical protein
MIGDLAIAIVASGASDRSDVPMLDQILDDRSPIAPMIADHRSSDRRFRYSSRPMLA